MPEEDSRFSRPGDTPQVEIKIKLTPDEIEKEIRDNSTLFTNNRLATQEITPLDMFDMYYEREKGIFTAEPIESVRKWLLSVASSCLKGASYKPTMNLSDAAAWKNWTMQHPELYALAMQFSPSFKAADFQARMSVRANEFKDEVIPGDKVFQVANEEIDKQPSVADAITGLPKAAGEITSLAGDISKQVVEVLLEIVRLMNEVVIPMLRDMWSVMKESMRPAVEFLNQEIFQPYKKIAEDGKVAFEQYRNMVEQQNRSVDATVPSIVPPNVQDYVKLLPILAKYFNLPIIGSVAKAELQAMDMVDYQATQMRGFGSPLKMLDYAAGMSAPAGPGQALNELMTKPPAWFLSNI